MTRIRGFELVKEEARQNHVKCILLPKRSTKNSAGYDFFLPKSVAILPHCTTLLWTGIIDSDYYNNPTNDGNIGIMLRNMTDEVIELMGGEKIMQGIFTKYLIADNDNATEERIGGIGSTGKGN